MNPQLAMPMERIDEFCRKWRISELALFGSALRDDFRPDSDLDVLVSFLPDARHSLFDLAHMQDELGEIFGRAVDLVEREAVERSRNYIRRKAVLESAETIYVPQRGRWPQPNVVIGKSVIGNGFSATDFRSLIRLL